MEFKVSNSASDSPIRYTKGAAQELDIYCDSQAIEPTEPQAQCIPDSSV